MNIEQARFNMIEQQIRPWDVLDPAVLELIAIVKREDFLPPALRAMAFFDTEVPLGHGEHMLSPKLEARLLQEAHVKRHERVLEIGAGSGHMAALLSHRARQVVTLEINPALAVMASENLRRAAITNVTVLEADGAKRLPTAGPFDVIVLSGSVAAVPQALLQEIKIGGRLIAVLGQEPVMQATLVTRISEHEYRSTVLFDTMAPRLHGFDEPSRFTF
jgi:protein-L-isoaspartate(D-aspartate) O-methyltransferase